MSHLLLLHARINIARFHTKNRCHDVVLIANRLQAKTKENTVKAHRTPYLITLSSHHSFHAAEILLASTTRSH